MSLPRIPVPIRCVLVYTLLPARITGDENGLQIEPYDVEGSDDGIADLLNKPAMAEDMGKKAEEIAREKFLITRLPSEYLYMLNSILKQSGKSTRLSLTRPKISGRLSLLGLHDLFCQIIEQSVHFWIGFFGLTDFMTGVHDSRMIPSAQVASDFFEAVFRQIPG